MQNKAVPGLPITQYVYDAEGARIGKGTLSAAPPNSTSLCAPPLSSGFTLSARYLVDQGGDQVTEINGAGQWQHSNVFSAARLTATYDYNSGNGGLHFELADPLGTKRVQANIYGQIEMSWASLPFGEAQYCTGDDATEHHFTQKERDTESGNDYFEARYYSSAFGRFMSPDWSTQEEPVPYAKLDDPQTLNLYSYVQNNPLSRFDDDGHDTYLMVWSSGNGSFGHSAIAVSNYQTIEMPDGKGGTTNIRVPDGTYTYMDLWPGVDLNRVTDALKSVPGIYQVTTAMSEDDLKNMDMSGNENGRTPDGVLQISSGYERDMATIKDLNAYAKAHPNYRGTGNQCSSFAARGVGDALGTKLNAGERILGLLKIITPNHLWKAARGQKGVKVLKDPGSAVDTSFRASQKHHANQ